MQIKRLNHVELACSASSLGPLGRWKLQEHLLSHCLGRDIFCYCFFLNFIITGIQPAYISV